jgi:hypothetical protein
LSENLNAEDFANQARTITAKDFLGLIKRAMALLKKEQHPKNSEKRVLSRKK